MKKKSFILIVCLVLLVFLGSFFYISLPKVKKENNLIIRETPQFIFKYPANYFTKKELKLIFNETNYAYKNISKFLNIKHPSKIIVNLKKGRGISGEYRNELYIHNLKNDSSGIPYAITKLLAGRAPAFVHEGLSVYMQDKFSRPGYVTYIYPMDLYVLAARERDVYMPLEELVHEKPYIFRKPENILNWLVASREAGSFVKFLIENYGLDKFMKIYKDQFQSYKEVYNKSLSTLETEWFSLLDKKQLTNFDKSKILILEGFYDVWQKDKDKAIEFYKKAVKANPDDNFGYTMLAWAYIDKEMYEEAIKYALKALEIDPKDAKAMICLATGYVKTNKYNKATNLAKEALKSIDNKIYLRNSYKVETFSVLGEVYLKKGNLKKGKHYFDKALSLSDAYQRVHYFQKYHYNLGLFYKDKGDKDKAEAEFKKVIKSDKIAPVPESKYAKEAKMQLKNL